METLSAGGFCLSRRRRSYPIDSWEEVRPQHITPYDALDMKQSEVKLFGSWYWEMDREMGWEWAIYGLCMGWATLYARCSQLYTNIMLFSTTIKNQEVAFYNVWPWRFPLTLLDPSTTSNPTFRATTNADGRVAMSLYHLHHLGCDNSKVMSHLCPINLKIA
jgi:hypothetical protein